jgi:hypothetical protein
MGGCQGGERGVPQAALFGGVFEGEAGEFGGFIGGELVGGGGAGVGISDLHQSCAASGEFGDDQRDVAGVAG